MTVPLNPFIALFADQPALVEPSQSGRFEACLIQAAQHPQAAAMVSGEYLQSATDFWCEDGGWCRPYVVADGILQIPVKGVLLHNFPYQLYDWATGYAYIWEAFKRGCADFAIGQIKGIALVGDSPGGYVAECWDTVDKMVALKEQVDVPVAGFAHESAYSAAYGVIGGVADKGHVTVSRTGGVGSIGTFTTHIDRSGALGQAGLKVTFIASDPSKVEGNSSEPLSDDAKARIQARIDELNDIFVAAVARSRGLEESFIRETLKAYCFTATQATSNGLADHIGSLEDATSAFADFLDEPSETDGDEQMTTPVTAVDQAALDQARADGAAEATAAAQARIGAILSSEEATGREALARHFAFDTQMSADDAVAALKVAPKTQAAAPVVETEEGKTFSQAMDESPNPDVGANAAAAEAAEAAANGSDIIAIARSIGMPGVRPANAQ